MIFGVVNLREATKGDKSKVYEWFSNKDIAKAMLMGDDFPENPLPTREEFFEDYTDFYFDGTAPEKGRVYIIQLGNLPIGSISYASYHLKGKKAELDIWMKSIDYCGKGYGSEAIKALCNLLYQNQGINQYIIRPSNKNKNAIRAYEKAGFVKVLNLSEKFVNDTFVNGYVEGDYGIGNDILLIKDIK